MTSGIDRRAHPRHEHPIGVLFRTDGTEATTRDISRGGCAILAPRMRLVNERLSLTLGDRATGEMFDVIAEVKRAMAMPDGKWLLGVQFVDVDEATQKKIGSFVDSLAAQRAAAAPAPAAGDEASQLVGAASDAEHAGNRPEAMKLLDRAITVAPKRADILVTRARLASETGDMRGAAHFAKRAAELEPDNATYAQLYQRFTAHDLAALPNASAPRPTSVPAPAPAPAPATKPFIPTDRRSRAMIAAATLMLLGVVGGNLWHWVLRVPPGSPVRLDPSAYSDLVPMSSLAVRDGRAFGTVEPAWSTLPDREKRLADLASRLRGQKVNAVFLSDAESRLVATHKDGAARLFK